MKMTPVLVLLILIGGCRHGAPRVDCDRRLEPINPPKPVVPEAPAPSGTSP